VRRRVPETAERTIGGVEEAGESGEGQQAIGQERPAADQARDRPRRPPLEVREDAAVRLEQAEG
jgi:hypothetical protein